MSTYGNAGLYFKLLGNLFIPDYPRTQVRNAVKQTMREAVPILQKYTPVDTGHLRSQWRASLNSFTDYRIDVATNSVYYGVFVDEGTRYIKARNFVAKGTREIEGRFLDNLQAAIDKLK